MKKRHGDIIILHMGTKNDDEMMYGCSLNMVCNRRTDGQKKWHTEVGAPPKKINYGMRLKM